jgi:hypothetical protein
MNKQVIYCFLILLITPIAIYAEQINNNGNYWECTTHDASNTQWNAQSFYEKIALNLSYAQCKRKSQSPTTCKTSQSSCVQYVKGVNVMPMWRCTALDREALPWRSKLYPNREDAALAAEAFCKQESPVPSTCYMNLITCVNINVM